jgi:hypothetical protein
VFSAAVLLTIAVRGFHGTLWVASFTSTHFQMLANEFPKFVKELNAAYDRECVFESQKTWACHIEGRHTSQSGHHPLQALNELPVQTAFLELVKTWEEHMKNFLLLRRQANPLTESVLLAMSEAVAKHMPLAMRSSGQLLTAGDYTVQNICKGLNSLLPLLFNVAPLSYSCSLHDFLERKQAHGSFGLGLKSFGLVGFAGVTLLAAQLKTPTWSQLAIDDIPFPQAASVHSMLKQRWGVALVHICETRQVLQHVPMWVLHAIFKSPMSRYKGAVQNKLRELFGDSRRTQCFSVLLVATAATALGITYKRPTKKSIARVSKRERMLVCIALARKGLSPKASVVGIPEWVTLAESCLMILARLPGQKMLSMTKVKLIRNKYFKISMLRKRVSKLKCVPQLSDGDGGRINLTKAKLLRLLASHRATGND